MSADNTSAAGGNDQLFDKFCGQTFWVRKTRKAVGYEDASFNFFLLQNENIFNGKEFLDFSRCFQHTVLLWIPSAFLLVTSPILICASSLSPEGPDRNRLNWSKLILAKLVLK